MVAKQGKSQAAKIQPKSGHNGASARFLILARLQIYWGRTLMHPYQPMMNDIES